MDPLTTLPPAPATTAGTASIAPTGAAANGALSADFETFLKMLTTQMRNQDPLNPIDSTDFAVQLATFSTVEQQVQTNDLLTGLTGQMATIGMGQFVGWIGLEAEVAGPVAYDGAPVRLSAPVAERADGAELVVTDAQGAIVLRQAIAPQGGPVVWQGHDSRGRPLPHGTYDIAVESLSRGEVIAREAAQLLGRIEEARRDGDEVRLILETGQSVRATDVLGLRPSPPPA